MLSAVPSSKGSGAENSKHAKIKFFLLDMKILVVKDEDKCSLCISLNNPKMNPKVI